MKLYFGNWVTTATTAMIIALMGFLAYSFVQRGQINFWGRRMLIVSVFGLLICCFATARDGLDKSIQFAIDGTGTPGIFSLTSIPIIIACVGAAVIVLTGVIAIFCKSQQVKEVLFYLMAGGILLKIVTVEIGRIVL